MAFTQLEEFKSPLQESLPPQKIPDDCILVIFGATGDLTARKLIPAIYNLAKDGDLPPNFSCVAIGRRIKDDAQFRQEMYEAVSKFSRTKPIDQDIWKKFSERLFYHILNFQDDKDFDKFPDYLHNIDEKFNTKGNHLFYLSIQPTFFPLIIKKLSHHNLIYNFNETKNKWSRVIIEKPFGRDYDSATALENELTELLDEKQIYRIDHYLGKETVQNLMVFRFSNLFFENLWNNRHIDHVQITVSEQIGIGTRGKFFEEAGILRDIVQNHIMQLVTLVAMEPPINSSADAIRDEKVKVVEAIRPFSEQDFKYNVVRGQYGPGYIQGEKVKGYREEDNVSPTSSIETFLALKLFIENWRWDGVPFYIRAGKRLAKHATEISIGFRKVPGFLFDQTTKQIDSNLLVIRIQPDEGISLKMNSKIPGLDGPILPVKMDFSYKSYFGQSSPEAYERLIVDSMAGDSTLFSRIDEVMASWRIFTPILDWWQNSKPPSFPNYPAGSWGPEEAEKLLERDNCKWRLI